MIVHNLRRPGDYRRQILARNEYLKKEIENDNKIASMRENQRKGILQEPTPEQDRTLAERVGDANQRRQKTFDNLIQVFTPEQVGRFMPLLTDDMFYFINVYWPDMKRDFQTKTNPKLLDEFYFKNYIQKYAKLVMEQKGLSSSNEKGVSINEAEEIDELMKWKPEAVIALKRFDRGDPYYERLNDIIQSVPTKQQIAQINALSDAEKQSLFNRISELFNDVEPDPMVWKRVNAIKNDIDFKDAVKPLFEGMNNMDIRELTDLYEQIKPKPTKKRGQPAEAEPFFGEIDEPNVVVARPLGATDYIVPTDFENERKGVQNSYIQLLSKVLPADLKKKVFGVNDKDKPNSVAYYTKKENEGNKEMFNAKLIKYDKEVKAVLSQKTGTGIKRGRPASGKGIASTCKEQTPRWVVLGRFRINGRLLDEKQLLSVRYQSGTATPLFPKLFPISDSFHELLTFLFQTGKLDKRLLKELDPEERRTAETLLVKSGVGRGVGLKEVTPTDEETEKMKRFEVVKGSYLSGNNSKDVIHELRSLILHFVGSGKLSRKDGLRSLMELQ